MNMPPYLAAVTRDLPPYAEAVAAVAPLTGVGELIANRSETRRGRRLRLWHLAHKHHCPVIGTCLPMSELRRLAHRAGIEARTMSDYSLHVLAVGHAEERNVFAEEMQRALDKRYAASVARFAQFSDVVALHDEWARSLASGDIAGALWAVLTHPACDEDTGAMIYGDIHMISHQIGASTRADIARLALSEEKCLSLDAALRELRQRSSARIAELERALREREESLHAARLDLTAATAVHQRQLGELAAARGSEDREKELRRQNEQLQHRCESMRGEIAGLRRRAEKAEAKARADEAAAAGALAATVTRAMQAADCADCVDGSDCAGYAEMPAARRGLDGRCLLCVGGRDGQVEHYRRLVETSGGRFLHHDGGLQDNPHRLAASLATADAVICQAGCISHAAYWRLKEHCKRTNKPCIYLKQTGVASFAQGVQDVAGEALAKLAE